MANRFLNNITINDEYTLPSADGTADQIITTDGAGQLSFVDQSTVASGTSRTVSILVKNISSADGGVNLSKGDPVYVYGSVGASERLYVDLADAGDSSKMPCVALLDQDLSPNGEGTATVTGKLKNLITSPIDGATPTENDTIYVKSGGGLTLTKPTGSSNLIQNVGQVGRVSTSSDGNIVVSAILRSNDVPNLTTGKIWVGSPANTIESATVHLDETNGRMGIGTDSPNDLLEIKSTTIPSVRLNSTDTSFPTFGSITAYNNTTYRGGLTWAQNPAQNGARITYIGFPSGTQTTGTFEVGSNFVDTSIGNGSMVTRLNTTGLGIGTTSPAYMLDVDGEVRVGDNQKLKLWDDPFGAIITPLDAHLALTTTRIQDNIYFDPGNSTKMVIEGGGNVGIGTTSPAKKLTIGGIGLGNTDGLKIEDPSNTAYGAHYSYDDGSTTVEIGGVVNNTLRDCISIARDATRTITINTSEFVGIGTTTPQERLHVQNYTTGESHQAMFKGGAVTVGDYSYISLNNGYSAEYNKEVRLAAVSEQSNSNKTGFAVLTSPDANGASGHERLRVTADGNVGIGTTSPNRLLTVQTTGTGSYLALNSSSNNTTIGSDVNGAFIVYDDTAAAYRMVIKPTTGHVGIGTTSPSPIGTNITTLDIQGSSGGGFRFGTTAGVEGGLWSLGSGTTLGSISSIPLYFRTGNQNRAAILANGNFGIGTTSPTTKLHVLGTTSSMPSLGAAASAVQMGGSSYGTLFSTLTSGRGVIQQGRSDGISTSYDLLLQPVGGRVGIARTSASYTLDVSGTGRFTGDLRCLSLIQTSQRDQKENINDIDKSKAKAIPFKEYTYKSSIDGSERKRYGVVAEDIENDYPELVHTGADGIKGINYIDLLVKRVAELEKELEDISLTPGPKGDTGATGPQGPAGANGTDGNSHLSGVSSIQFNSKTNQLEITIGKTTYRFNPAK